MDKKILRRAFGIVSFLVALVVYLLTVQPTVPFWDCGEFSAASIWQEVPHPPGAPLFLMIGKVFHLLIPFGDDGWRLNMVSVVSAALTIWLIYLIAIKVIIHFRKEEIETTGDALAVYGSAFVGSIALVFSDTFWFNAVESEVYALSSLFVALVVYLMMRWNEEADNPGHERYLLLIAYLMGLSTGVHLLALLAIFSIVYLVYFRKYEFKPSSFILTGIIAILIFFIIYPGIVKWVPAMLAGNLPFKNKCREYIVEGNPIITLIMAGSVIMAALGLWYGYKRKLHTLNLICAAFLLMIFGYSTYTQILLRSNANPPMNENEPKDLKSLTAYLGREQYGEAPNWPRRYHASDEYYTSRYDKKDEKGEYVYGKWIPPGREDVQCKDGRGISLPDFKKTNFWGEIGFMRVYQIGHMYLRYFFWNYVGRKSDVQDAGAAWFDKADSDNWNYQSGYKSEFPIRFYALPLLLGLFGLFYHFYKDPKMAFIYLTMFLMMGVLTALAQNQQEPQPRERDYFYAGSFFVFCIWIGMGTYGLIKGLNERKLAAGIVAGILLAAALLVPVNMAVGGWKIHSRAGNYIPFDYSYNILQSTEKDAIIFTNGDNDTFPLWYLQDVAGVRRDVRVVNLSLANTLWYVDQLKNREPWGAKKIPLSFSDDSIQVSESNPLALSYDFGVAFNVTIPVDKEILKKYTSDPMIIDRGEMSFVFTGKRYAEREGKTIYLYRVQDKLILDILQQVRFRRPVYFSVTVGPESFCGFEKYFRHEGMAMRICPVVQRSTSSESLNSEIMEACLLNVDNSNNYHKEPRYGFKFRNLSNPDVYYDEVHRRLMITYRTLFVSYANYALQIMKKPEKCVEILDSMNHYVSPEQFPLNYEMEFKIARIYEEAGAKAQTEKMARMGIESSLELINNPDLKPELIQYETMRRYFGPYRTAAYLYEMLGDYAAARNLLERFYTVCEKALFTYQSNPAYNQLAPEIEYNMLSIQANIDDYVIKDAKQNYGIQAAYDSALGMYQRYANSDNPALQRLSSLVLKHLSSLEGEMKADSNITEAAQEQQQ